MSTQVADATAVAADPRTRVAKADARHIARRRKRARGTAARAVAAVLMTLLFLGPIIWMVTTAFKVTTQAFTQTPTFFFSPTMDNFRAVLTDQTFVRAIFTSFFVALLSTIFTLILGAGIAYPLARFKVPGKSHLAFWILSLRIVPPIVVIVPLFLLLRNIGLTGSVWSMVLLYTYANLPLTVWLMRGFFAELPREIEDAALVDGSSRMRMFVDIVIPLVTPGLVATGLLAFIFSWNEFLFANILAGADNRTAPVSLTQYVTPTSIDWTQIMAAGTVVMLPVWIIALCVQRYLVRGLTLGAVK
jgi:ABC-type glycerol-3-phosphate transport system permease component